MARYIEFILGLIGGILGIIGSGVALAVGGITIFLGANNAGHVVTTLGLFGMLFSVIGIIGALSVKRWAKGSGVLMIIGAVGGIISVNIFYIFAFILLLVSGSMALFRTTALEREAKENKPKIKPVKVLTKKSTKAKPKKVKSKKNKK